MKFFLFFIITIAIFFRLYQLSSVPANVHIDEISFGYNAYAMSQTGKDEYGKFLPLTLEAYDDYRPALYSYLMIPFIKILGLNVFSIRLTSVFLSIGTLIGIYFLVKELVKTKQQDPIFLKLPEIVTFLYAISPWGIFYARLAIDTNASQFFFICGLLFFLRFVNRYKNKDYNLFISVAFFLLTVYSYNGEKLSLPPFLIGLLLIFRKELLYDKKRFFSCILVACIGVLPLVTLFANTRNSAIRFTATSIFAAKTSVIEHASNRLLHDRENNNFLGVIFDNRRIMYLTIFVNNYLSNFNPAWLYTNRGDENYKSPDFGLFYLFEIFFLILGMYAVSKYSFVSKKIGYLLILWILTSVLSSGLTTESPHATRTYNLLPAMLLLEGFGMYYLLSLISKVNNGFYKKGMYVSLCICLVFFVMWFAHSYFVTFRRESAYKYQDGIAQAFVYAKEHENKYKKIIVSNKNNLVFSYMYFLFYNAYDPKKYIANGGTQSGSFNGNNVIGKYAFINPAFFSEDKRDVTNKNAYRNNDSATLYIVDINDVPVDPSFWEDMRIIKIIKSLDGTDVMYIIRQNKN